ncbi:AraC family transcriptional regulator [Clostridium estertheticum]|uniref:AraC family transcriptional regulator n=1 Tax=Clostridium estertheticum TaxID=238834 RepID=UPI0013E9426C|nr:AraC family transcriptional regulator [Clostridium estertheticum]MBZ9686017.1 AraC family transcriptional regulator [Clostridium estertheticum]
MEAFHENRSYREGIHLSISKSNSLEFLAHWHVDIEIIYVCEGNLRVGINNESRILTKGELAICSSGDIHYYDSKGMESSSIILIFTPGLIGFKSGWPENGKFIYPFIESELKFKGTKLPEVSNEILKLLNCIYEEMQQENQYYNYFVRSKLFELCGIILRFLPASSVDIKIDNRKLPLIKAMKKTIHYIENNYSEDITLESIAKKANLSMFYFSRVFKDIVGMNYKTYLNWVRVNKAESMIKTSNMPITDIAFECGFNSIRSFNRVYKAIKGDIPSNLR